MKNIATIFVLANLSIPLLNFSGQPVYFIEKVSNVPEARSSNEHKESASYVSFKLVMRDLICNKTTESGADEVYLLINGKDPNNTGYLERFPGSNFHWDMNDGDQGVDQSSGDSHEITNKVLVAGTLRQGESWSLNLTLMEEDGGESRGYQQQAAEMLRLCDDPYAQAGGKILDVLTRLGFFLVDSDDWMGMLGCKISNLDGTLLVEWLSKDGIADAIGDPQDPKNINKIQTVMTHDGSSYRGTFNVVEE